MDAIRKKMQSLKAETEQLYSTIRRYEDATKEYSARADQAGVQWCNQLKREGFSLVSA
jgi:hypothetical protein